MLLFYATSPVSGVVGYGSVGAKFVQDRPLWPQEIKERRVVWPLRFEFNVERCLPIAQWQTSKVTSDRLFPRAGFQVLDSTLAQELISKLASLHKEYPVQTPFAAVARESPGMYPTQVPKEQKASLSHDEVKRRLAEIGQLQGYIADEEYPFDIGKIDVVWRRVLHSVPTYAFEVQIGGDIYHAMAKLKHAFDLWNSHIFLVAAPQDEQKFESLLSGTFHEVSSYIKFIELDKVDELYKRKRAYRDFERQLGI